MRSSANIDAQRFPRERLLKNALTEVTGEEEDSLPGGVPGAVVELTHRGTTLVEVPQPRRFYRINDKGREASRAAWSDPLMALYGYPREVRSGKT